MRLKNITIIILYIYYIKKFLKSQIFCAFGKIWKTAHFPLGAVTNPVINARHCVKWWTRQDSNPLPPRCKRGALPAELLAHKKG